MALKKNLADLPKQAKPEGARPDPRPRFVHILAEQLAAQPPKPVAMGTPFRFSDAAKCARYLALKAAGAVPEPMDLAGHHVTHVGTLVHEAWQAAVAEVYPDAEFELKAAIGDLTSGSCDGLVEVDCPDCGGQGAHVSNGGVDLTDITDCGRCTASGEPGRLRILLELKTTGGFAFKMMVGERGPAEGPRTSYVVQTALNARAHDVDEAVICVLANEAISKGAADRKGIGELGRFAAEWTFTRAELEVEASREVARLEHIRSLLDDGKLAPRHVPYEMPQGARIVDVQRSRWELRDGDDIVDTGELWGGQFCGYCAMKTACLRTSGAGTVPTSEAEVAA